MKVAVAIIRDELHRILVTQRPMHKSHGGLWEFPGGKLEALETPEEALVRELREEVGIEITSYKMLGECFYRYPQHDVHLFVFYVDGYYGEPLCLEDQMNLNWFKKEELDPKDFPEANAQVLNLIPNPI